MQELKPLHERLNRGCETLTEATFTQSFSRDLREAEEWCNRYLEDGNTMYLNQAWSFYCQVFKTLGHQLENMKVQLENQFNIQFDSMLLILVDT